MCASAIVDALLEDGPEDPKDFVHRNAVELDLAAYFNETESGKPSRTVYTRDPEDQRIAAHFTACWNPEEEQPYVGLSWGIENTDSYTDYGHGGGGQLFTLKSRSDKLTFLRDLKKLERAVTIDFDIERARFINDNIMSRISYRRPNGYSKRS